MSSPVTQRTDAIGYGTVHSVPQYAAVNLAASGELIAAVSGKQIRAIAGCLVAAAPVTAEIKSGGTSGTALTGAMSLVAGAPLVLPLCQFGHFESALGADLYLTLGSGVQVSGYLVYILR